jgi:predicted Zn-dependent protease
MKRALSLAVFAAACGHGPRYLGAPLPAACERGDVERCAGWMAERDLVAGQLDSYDDDELRAYVQGITDRLARGSTLRRAPRVVIGDHDGTSAAFGERIVIGRIAIERLGSEAELAAIVAHELVHVEGRHAAVTHRRERDTRARHRRRHRALARRRGLARRAP